MIDPQTIQRIHDAAQIVEVVSDFVTLRRRGVNMVGLCPFHDDRTPSFYVSPAKNICKCFACDSGGSPVHFIMKHEQMSYPEALRYLAKKYNIEIVEKEYTDEEKKAQSDRESMFILNEFARDYFVKNLHESEEGRTIGLSYFRERGFRDDIIRKFELGYGSEQKNAFVSAAQKAGYNRDFLLKTGLAVGGDDNYPLSDRFRGRVIFPVHTLSGKIAAFGGRILKKADKLAKYVNSPESEIYSKSRELYGIFFAKSAIVKADKCYLVEGYTDVISMHQAGVENVVATSGTALTHQQIRMIHRFSENITLLFDSDKAGIGAAMRGIDMLLEDGMNVRVVLLPEGEDPDSFARQQNAAGFHQYMNDNEQDFIRFKTQLLLKEAGNDPIKRSGIISNIVQSIAVIPDAIKRSIYTQESSVLLNIREKTIIDTINKIRIKNYEKSKENEQKKEAKEVAGPIVEMAGTKIKHAKADGSYDNYEREIIRYIIRYGHLHTVVKYELEKKNIDGVETEVEVMHEYGETVIEFVHRDLSSDSIFFANPLYRFVYEEACRMMSDPNWRCPDYFSRHADPAVSQLASDLVSDKYQLSKLHARLMGEGEDDKSSRLRERNSLDRLVERATTELKNAHVKNNIENLKRKMKNVSAEEQEELMKKLILLNEAKSVLAKRLGERIVLKF